MVVVQVRQQDGIRVAPQLTGRRLAPPAQRAHVAAEEWVGQHPGAVDVQHDGRMTEPRHVHGHVRHRAGSALRAWQSTGP